MLCGLFFPISSYSKETNTIMFIIDRKPWKMNWIEASKNNWVLEAYFDKGVVKTYFKQAPPSKGMGLSYKNKPIKQEFIYYPSDQTFVSKNFKYEQWPDGAKTYSCKYEKSFKIKNDKFDSIVITLVEEVGTAPHEVRYALFRQF